VDALVTPARKAIVVAGLFGIASFIRDAVLFRTYGFYVHPDSASYLDGSWLRSRPYPVMAWLTDAIDHPRILIWLQLLIGAIAIAALVWVIWRNNRVLAVVVGIVFLLDINWATMDRVILSEGPFMSFSILSLAALGYLYERRARLHPVALLMAGVLFAWTCTIRPSNMYLLLPIAAAYLLFTRSLRMTAWLSTGMIVLLLASAWLTVAQTGKFRISGGTGYFVAFPLFSYHLFSPSNGPASAQIDHAIKICDPNVDYSKVVILTSNQYLWGDFFGCLSKQGWSDDRVDQTFSEAYVEAIRAHPQQWGESWGGWFVIELGYPLDEAELLITKAVGHLPTQVRAFWLSSIPNPNGDTDLYNAMDAGTLSWEYVIAILIVCCAALALVWVRTTGTIRVVTLGAIVTIAYVCASVPAGHVFLPRYVTLLSPLNTLVFVVVLFVLAGFATTGVRRFRTNAT
jgi:hypothetical protein